MAIDRTNYNALVDDDGSNTVGTNWTKTQIKNVLLDPIDAAINAVGAWTPTIGGAGGQTGQVYTSQFGSYVKVGALVYANFLVALSTLGTITGAVQIQGLPFPAANLSASNFSVSAVLWGSTTATFVNMWANIGNAGSVASLVGVKTAAGTNTPLAQADLSNTTNLIGTLIYRA